MAELPVRPLFRWAGSKKKLIPKLKQYWNEEFNTYIEPFAGSAQLFFSLNPKHCVIGDRNQSLISTYQQVKNQPRSVYKALRQLQNSKNDYYRIRAIRESSLGRNQRAARFIYLNWLCFNGLYRTNNSGDFNVPYSNETPKSIDNWELIKKVSEKLKFVHLMTGDFEYTVRSSVKKNDFVYLDPPYAVENVRIFNQYGNHTFGINDLNRVASLIKDIDAARATFVLSYADCVEARRLFKSWNVECVEVQRNIAGFSRFRRKSSELLITNINEKNDKGRGHK